jgi:AsmA-like C-terminal region
MGFGSNKLCLLKSSWIAPNGTERRGLMRKWVIAGVAAVLVLLVVAAVLMGPAMHSFVRARTQKVLETHFASSVEFSDFDVTLFPRLRVTITGLVLRHKGRTDIPPLIQVQTVTMYAQVPALLKPRPYISFVQLDGLQIHTPPREPGGQPMIQKTDQDLAKKYPVLIGEVRADDANIEVLRAQSDKPPREFPIHNLDLHDVSFDRPAQFHALLTNAIPKGEIDATGQFGPWLAEEPSETPADGHYIFQNADLGTLKGLRGILSSKGQFSGPLDYLTVAGYTDTPDFGLRTGGQPVALHTDFSALVDGTNGDVTLKGVTAKFLHTTLLVSGKIVDVSKVIKGRTIYLNASSENARIEDLLRLAVNSDEPMMTGSASLKTTIDIPEGADDLLDRMKLAGQFGVGHAQFTRATVQEKVDTLSRKGQGKPKDTDISDVASDLRGNFRFADGVVTFSNLSFGVQGASVHLDGTYNIDSTAIDFNGDLLMQAKLSQTTTGAKSFFLKAADPFFKGKNGGSDVPIKIGGTKDHPTFGLGKRGGNKQAEAPGK